MAFNINDFTQYFDNPAVSVFDRSQNKSFPMRISKLYPAKWELLSFGNSQKSSSAHAMRVAPMIVPTLTNMRFQEHSAVVPLRSIIQNYEETFNYATNKDGATLPHFTLPDLLKIYTFMLQNGLSLRGSLFDFLGFPVFCDLYKAFSMSFSKSSRIGPISYNEFTRLFTDPVTPLVLDIPYRDLGNVRLDQAYPFVFYIALSTGNPYGLISNVYPDYENDQSAEDKFIYPSDLISYSSYDTVSSAMNSYINAIFAEVLNYYITNFLGDVVSEPYSTLPFRAYFRFHYDWNINGNFVDRDVQLQNFVFNFEETLLNAVSNQDPESLPIVKLLTTPVNRLWNDDFFTSLLPTSAVDNAVEIPANSTVLDLAKLTAWQKFVMRLSYSSRYRDVAWNIFKIKPSDARLMQSYPILQKSHNIAVGEVLQSSQSTTQSVLGDFAGRAYSSGKNKGYHIFCEEPSVIIDFCSIIPEAVYADALHPLIHVDDILDFPIPDMDVLGNQPITSEMVSGNPIDSSIVLGYGRQYQPWLHQINTVHGEFKTDLDYWVLTRRFIDGVPVINDDFLRMHDADDFDKIFSVYDTPHAYLDIYFDAAVSRPVHRNVRIKI